jgi:O-acetyl-ADP-ribose deacetylase (regulator of RNase III)
MIHYVSGDILLTDADAVAHGVAPGDDFAQGLALSLREQWPAMYKDFRHWDRQFHPKPGEVWAWARTSSAVDITPLVATTLAFGGMNVPSKSAPAVIDPWSVHEA